MFSIPPEEAVAIARACVSLAINGGMPSSVEISKEVAHGMTVSSIYFLLPYSLSKLANTLLSP